MLKKLPFSFFELAELFILFLFSLAFFNRSGQIFFVLLVVVLAANIKNIEFGRSEILLSLFCVAYFIFYLLNYGFKYNDIVLYLAGPIGAFIIGKCFLKRSSYQNAFMTLLFVPAFGMLIHGLLNLYAYRTSYYYSSYSYLRLSVDFWRGGLIAVTATGMFYTFMTGLSTGVLWSKVKTSYKIFAAVLLLISFLVTVFYANRTLLLIIFLLFVWQFSKAMFSPASSKAMKIIGVVFLALVLIAFLVMVLGELDVSLFGRISSLKIIDRLKTDDNEVSRFEAWLDFFKDFHFIDYPFGGDHLLDNININYFHNLWLDTYNTVGIFPFTFLVMFTVRIFRKFFVFKRVSYACGNVSEYVIFSCLMAAVLLNCMVEPIIESNPYYFFIVLMYLGAMEKRTDALRYRTLGEPV